MSKRFLKKGLAIVVLMFLLSISMMPNIIGRFNSNDPPVVSNPNPTDGSIVNTNLSQLSVFIKDDDGDRMNWTIETSPDIGSNEGIMESMGSKHVSISNLKFSQKYKWFVNVTDGKEWTRKVYFFTTGDEPKYVHTIAETEVFGQARNKINFFYDTGKRVTHIYNWTPGDNQVRIKWDVFNEYKDTSGTITFYYRIREWQPDLPTLMPLAILYFLEGGCIRTPEYEGFAKFIEIPIHVEPAGIDGPYVSSGCKIVNVTINNPGNLVEMCCYVSHLGPPWGMFYGDILTTWIHFQ